MADCGLFRGSRIARLEAYHETFSRKWFENYLLSSAGEEAKRDKRTRDYIRKSAGHLETAYLSGVKDRREGKPAQDVSSIEAEGLAKNMIEFAAAAYTFGYTFAVMEKRVIL